MSEPDFDAMRSDVHAAITALHEAITVLRADRTRAAVCAVIDLQHIIRDLESGLTRITNLEKTYKGEITL